MTKNHQIERIQKDGPGDGNHCRCCKLGKPAKYAAKFDWQRKGMKNPGSYIRFLCEECARRFCERQGIEFAGIENLQSKKAKAQRLAQGIRAQLIELQTLQSEIKALEQAEPQLIELEKLLELATA